MIKTVFMEWTHGNREINRKTDRHRQKAERLTKNWDLAPLGQW